MKEIKLTQGKVALVDDEDYEYLSQFQWQIKKTNGLFYAKRGVWVTERNNNIHIYMHREIIDAPIKMDVDHIDGNGLNNQKSNLRICVHAQNMANMKKRKGKQYKGITPRREGWLAQIKVNYAHIYLGDYKTKEDAARAYDRAAIKYFGEFANLNFKI